MSPTGKKYTACTTHKLTLNGFTAEENGSGGADLNAAEEIGDGGGPLLLVIVIVIGLLPPLLLLWYACFLSLVRLKIVEICLATRYWYISTLFYV